MRGQAVAVSKVVHKAPGDFIWIIIDRLDAPHTVGLPVARPSSPPNPTLFNACKHPSAKLRQHVVHYAEFTLDDIA